MHHFSFFSLSFTMIASQRKVTTQLYSVMPVFSGGIASIYLWTGRGPRNSDLRSSSLDDSEMLGGAGQNPNGVFHHGYLTREL